MKKTVRGFVLLSILAILLLVLQYGYFVRKETEQELALAARICKTVPEKGAEVYRLLFETEDQKEMVKKGRELLSDYGYTPYGEVILRSRRMTAGERTIVIIAAVLFFGSGWLLLSKDLRRQTEEKAEDKKTADTLKKALGKEKETQAMNQRLKEFIENIAHQIKAPVAGCLTSLELLQELPEVGENPEADTRVEECVQRMSTVSLLTERLLTIGRMEAGEVIFAGEEIELKELLLVLADEVADRKACEFNFSPDDRPLTWYGSYSWTYEALLNMMADCAEYDTSDKPLSVSCAEEGDWFRIVIRDHGQGFKEEDLPQIFDRFFRPDNMRKGHVGLGLNLAREIIEGQQGQVRADNAPDGGAMFTVRLPRLNMLK